MSHLHRPLARIVPAALAAALVPFLPAAGVHAEPTTTTRPDPVERDTIALSSVDADALAQAPDVPEASDERVVAMTDEVDTADFRVAGVTWSGDRTDVEAFVRTRDTSGAWTDWSTLEPEAGPKSETAGGRAGTQPLITAPSDGIQVRVESSGARPADLRLDVIDPGTRAADAHAQPATTAAPKPTVSSRADWGADESRRKGDPSYGEVRGAVVHHTAGVNAYSKADVPGILRGIYDYHVNSRGWDDIGYNVLVDKWGRLWEGRFGGLDKPVIGAHAQGVNDQTFGISAMGDYDVAAAPDAMVTSIQRFLAWKLDLHDVDPTAKKTIGGVWRSTVMGHRSVGDTVCPGQYLTSRLGEIRTGAKERQTATP